MSESKNESPPWKRQRTEDGLNSTSTPTTTHGVRECGIVVLTAEGVGASARDSFDPHKAHEQVTDLFKESLVEQKSTATIRRIKKILKRVQEQPLVIVNAHGDLNGSVYLRYPTPHSASEEQRPYSASDFAKIFEERKVSGMLLLSCYGDKTVKELASVVPFVIYHKGELTNSAVTEYLLAFNAKLQTGESVYHAHYHAAAGGRSEDFKLSGEEQAKLVGLRRPPTNLIRQRRVNITAEGDMKGQEFDEHQLHQSEININVSGKAMGQVGMSSCVQEDISIVAKGNGGGSGQRFLKVRK